MKKNTHPQYRDVLFVDSSTGHKFVCGSTLKTDKTEKYEGKEYPVYYAPISSASHPFFTGSKQFIDSEGRVNKFMKKYASATQKLKDEVVEQKKQEEAAAAATKKKKK